MVRTHLAMWLAREPLAVELLAAPRAQPAVALVPIGNPLALVHARAAAVLALPRPLPREPKELARVDVAVGVPACMVEGAESGAESGPRQPLTWAAGALEDDGSGAGAEAAHGASAQEAA